MVLKRFLVKILFYVDRIFNHKIPNKIFLQLQHFFLCGERINFTQPKSFNEKLKCIQLNNYLISYSRYVDKLEVRKFVEEKVGTDILIPLIGVFNNPQEINFEELPDRFVLKATHDSGSVIICRDKKNVDRQKIIKRLNRVMSRNYALLGREMQYLNIVPKIICEELIETHDGMELKDYKIFCFQGQPKFIQVDIDRFSNHKRNIYDLNWNLMDVEILYKREKNIDIIKPNNFDEMIRIAKILSCDFEFVRVDLYSANCQIYFGELTFTPGNGNETISPKSYDMIWGALI